MENRKTYHPTEARNLAAELGLPAIESVDMLSAIGAEAARMEVLDALTDWVQEDHTPARVQILGRAMRETSASRWIVYSRMSVDAVAHLLAARDPDLLRSILRTPAILEEV